MKKHIGSLVFGAMLLFSLSLLCSAAETAIEKQRDYPGFTDVSSSENPYFNGIKTCYELDWLNPISKNTFGVNKPLTKPEMVLLLARLYNVRHGGDGAIPPLPEDLGDCVRFYDADGTLFCNAFTAHCLDLIAYGAGPQGLYAIFHDENLAQETLTIEIGFPGDGNACKAQGIRVGYDEKANFTKYLFTFSKDVDLQQLDPQEFQEYCRYLQNVLEVNRREGLDDPNHYDAILYLLYREPASLPYCSRTMFLEGSDDSFVWRAEFAAPLSGICAGLTETGEKNSAPDLPGEWEDCGDILSLYRMGILNGFDEDGTFGGREWLTRGQAAAITTRALNVIQS